MKRKHFVHITIAEKIIGKSSMRSYEKTYLFIIYFCQGEVSSLNMMEHYRKKIASTIYFGEVAHCVRIKLLIIFLALLMMIYIYAS